MQELKATLLECLRHQDFLRAGFLVGRIQIPNFSEEPYLNTIIDISAQIWKRCIPHKQDPVFKAQAINDALFEGLGLKGRSEKYKKTIDDPSQYYLHEVLKNKQGSSLTLTIFYLSISEQVGIPCECLAFPSYYLLKVRDSESEFYIDPFEHGKFLTVDDFQKKFRTTLQRNRLLSANLFERVTPYQLVARLAQQLKHVYILKGDALHALRAVEILTALFPNSPELTRDRGILYCEMEYFSKAKEDLEFYLKHRPNADDIREIRKLTAMLRGYRETVN